MIYPRHKTSSPPRAQIQSRRSVLPLTLKNHGTADSQPVKVILFAESKITIVGRPGNGITYDGLRAGASVELTLTIEVEATPESLRIEIYSWADDSNEGNNTVDLVVAVG